MVMASDLRPGMNVQIDDQMVRVLASEHRGGGGRMSRAMHVRPQSLQTGSATDRRLRPEEKIAP